MPCSFLLALSLFASPECTTCLTVAVERTDFQSLHMLDELNSLTKGCQPATPAPAVAAKPLRIPVVIKPSQVEAVNHQQPAIAERAPRQLPTVAVVVKNTKTKSKSLPMDLSSIELKTAAIAAAAPAIAERSVRIKTQPPKTEEWEQVAQAWPTLPPHVRSEILRLIDTGE